MLLRSWLSSLHWNHPRRRPVRRRKGTLGSPQSLEVRTLLTTITFSEQTGTANPLNGVDLGDTAAPTLGDLDGDGDLDLISGKDDGTFKYYKNTGTSWHQSSPSRLDPPIPSTALM